MLTTKRFKYALVNTATFYGTSLCLLRTKDNGFTKERLNSTGQWENTYSQYFGTLIWQTKKAIRLAIKATKARWDTKRWLERGLAGKACSLVSSAFIKRNSVWLDGMLKPATYANMARKVTELKAAKEEYSFIVHTKTGEYCLSSLYTCAEAFRKMPLKRTVTK